MEAVLLSKKKHELAAGRYANLIFFWIVLIGGAFSTLGYWWTEYDNRAQIQQRTEVLIEDAVALVKKRFGLYEYGLLGARGAILVAGPRKMTRATFELYMASRDSAREFPGARGFGYIRRVPVEQESRFLADARADGAPDFTISTLTAHQNDRFVIQYIYPEASNREAIGLDIGSEANRRKAALAAAITGQVQLTAPITLVQAEGKTRRGFVIFLPVYSSLLNQIAPDERVKSTEGWTYAPLIVDDVLFDLGPVVRNISLSITDKVDTKPFFTTHSEQDERVFNTPVISREIEFMGRQWLVSAQPRLEMQAALDLRSPIWVAVAGLLITFIVAGVCGIWLRKSAKKSAQVTAPQRIGVVGFLASAIFRKVFNAYLIIMLCVITVSAYLYLQREFNNAASTLVSHARYSEALINKQHQSYREVLIFLKSTPPVGGIMRAFRTGIDPNSQLSLSDWTERLAETFRAYMQSSSNVYQMRLIRADAEGRELLRVERQGEVVIRTHPSDLQSKGDRAYVIKTLKLNGDDIFISDIDPNIENGMIERPLRPTVRYAIKLTQPNGSAFGVIVINVEAQPLLNEISAQAQAGEFIYMTDSNAEFLLNPDEAHLYASAFGKTYGWNDAFTRIRKPFAVNNKDLSAWAGPQGDVVAVQLNLRPNVADVTGQIEISATFLNANIYQRVFSTLVEFALILAITSSFGLLLFYLYWVSNQRAEIANRVRQDYDDQLRKDNMFESLTELSPEAMIISDTKGVMVLVNSQAERLFGYHRDQMLGQNISMLVPSSIAGKHDVHVAGYVKNPVNRPMGEGRELFSRHAEGYDFPVEVSLSPVQLDDKMLIASSVRNISQRKEIEASLKNAIDEAKQASQAKSNFLANMSHEIRTPLNAVIGLAYLLKEADLSPSQLNLVNKIQLAGRSLLGIVNDVLDLAKIEANEMALHEAPCNLPEMLNELQSVFSSQAEGKGIELQLEFGESLPVWVNTDGKLLRQVLTNLLGNAIKFTNQGFVKLSAECPELASQNQQVVVFSIEDSGIGIDKSVQDKIFQPFNQADASTNRRFGGTGLGLSIVSTLGTMLGGKVGLESELNKGSRFWLEIPLVLSNVDDEVFNDSLVNALNILIAEDDAEDRARLESMAKSLGWTTSSVSNGQELVKAIDDRLQAGKVLPDLLMVDWQMPVMDGLSALTTLFDRYGRHALPAVLVISAYEQTQVSQLDNRHLISSFLHKPVTSSELFNAVNEIVSRHTGSPARVLDATKVESIKAKWLPGVKVLVVDDSDINLEVVGTILTRNGAVVTTASSGIQALEHLRQLPDAFDIVLMDIQMPVMDGLEAVSKIRQTLHLNRLPVVALTAGTMDEEKKRALSAGMDDFLTKPIEPSKLIHTLRKLVESYRGTAVMIESISTPKAICSSWPIIDGLKNSAELFQGDQTLFVFTLQRLLADHQNLESMADGTQPNLQAQESRLALAAQIHKLRGSSGLLGAQMLYDLASQAEILLRKGEATPEHLLSDIAKALIALRANSATLLEQWALKQLKKNEIDWSQVDVITPADLDVLTTALNDNDLTASDLVEANVAGLTVLLGVEEYTRFNEMVQNLAFQQAAELLRNALK